MDLFNRKRIALLEDKLQGQKAVIDNIWKRLINVEDNQANQAKQISDQLLRLEKEFLSIKSLCITKSKLIDESKRLKRFTLDVSVKSANDIKAEVAEMLKQHQKDVSFIIKGLQVNVPIKPKSKP